MASDPNGALDAEIKQGRLMKYARRSLDYM